MYLSRSVSVLWTNGAGLQYWCELSEKKALGTCKLQNVFLSHIRVSYTVAMRGLIIL